MVVRRLVQSLQTRTTNVSHHGGLSVNAHLGLLIYCLAMLTLPACSKQERQSPQNVATVAPQPKVDVEPHSEAVPRSPPMRPEIREIPPQDGPLLPIIASELVAAEREGRDLLVYVGATWCEPCKRFHDAVKAGALDATFPTLRLLEFDHDRDGQKLREAGYSSRMIPLFVAPDAEGRPTDARHAGAVKGNGAVDFLVPRLKRVLEQRRSKLPLPPLRGSTQ